MRITIIASIAIENISTHLQHPACDCSVISEARRFTFVSRPEQGQLGRIGAASTPIVLADFLPELCLLPFNLNVETGMMMAVGNW